MKKIILALVALFLLTSCENEEVHLQIDVPERIEAITDVGSYTEFTTEDSILYYVNVYDENGNIQNVTKSLETDLDLTLDEQIVDINITSDSGFSKTITTTVFFINYSDYKKDKDKIADIVHDELYADSLQSVSKFKFSKDFDNYYNFDITYSPVSQDIVNNNGDKNIPSYSEAHDIAGEICITEIGSFTYRCNASINVSISKFDFETEFEFNYYVISQEVRSSLDKQVFSQYTFEEYYYNHNKNIYTSNLNIPTLDLESVGIDIFINEIDGSAIKRGGEIESSLLTEDINNENVQLTLVYDGEELNKVYEFNIYTQSKIDEILQTSLDNVEIPSKVSSYNEYSFMHNENVNYTFSTINTPNIGDISVAVVDGKLVFTPFTGSGDFLDETFRISVTLGETTKSKDTIISIFDAPQYSSDNVVDELYYDFVKITDKNVLNIVTSESTYSLEIDYDVQIGNYYYIEYYLTNEGKTISYINDYNYYNSNIHLETLTHYLFEINDDNVNENGDLIISYYDFDYNLVYDTINLDFDIKSLNSNYIIINVTIVINGGVSAEFNGSLSKEIL